MKVLSTEQQTELQSLLEELSQHQVSIGLASTLNYWRIELRPKRIRKKLEITNSGLTISETTV